MSKVSDIFSGIVSGLVTPVTTLLGKKEERKKAVSVIRESARAAEIDGEVQVSLSKAEWENLAKTAEDGTWKDEYVTLIITSPILIILVACLSNDPVLLESVKTAIAELKAAGVDLGKLMEVTVYAAIGIRIFK